MLKADEFNELEEMCDFLSHSQNAIDKLAPSFEQHVLKQGIDAIEKCIDDAKNVRYSIE